ncbi:MAG: LemA family protein [Planctomycetes bacterium]|nr:LemA family protein [Planctomycetota bacterium]
MNAKGCALAGIAAIVLLALILLAGGCSSYKQVVNLDEGVKAQWSQVENQLQRRFDLIPNVVATVKGYAAHEKGVFDDIATARESYFQAKNVNDKAVAAGNVESALSRLLMLQENYPTLKANEGFLKLQDQLEGTENRIAVERGRYNDVVRVFNAYIRSPMGMLGNLMAHAERAEYFKVPESAKTAPKVDFGGPAASTPPAPAPAALPAPASAP